MVRKSVTSSNLKSVGYDPISKTLEIEFLSAIVYEYLMVPANVHDSLMAAASKGSYFAANIKDIYKCNKK